VVDRLQHVVVFFLFLTNGSDSS